MASRFPPVDMESTQGLVQLALWPRRDNEGIRKGDMGYGGS